MPQSLKERVEEAGGALDMARGMGVTKSAIALPIGGEPPMSRILLADDHPMIRTALEALLRDTDFEIVGTPAPARRRCAKSSGSGPDILLLDLQMPGGNGMDVLRARPGGQAQSAAEGRPADRGDRRFRRCSRPNR